MSDFIFKIRLLPHFIAMGIDEWKREIWRRDLDSAYCCDGRECGCYAMTTRDVWTCNTRKDERSQ